MAVSVDLIIQALITGSNQEIKAGTEDGIVKTFASSTSALHHWQATIGNGTTFTAWDSANSPVTSGQVLIFLSDQNIMLELHGTTSANNNHINVAAGFPFVLSSFNTLANGASFAGASQTFTKILGKNSSGAAAQCETIVVAV